MKNKSHVDQRIPPAIFLMGPTASGKTEAAMYLCKRLPCELISVDSAQVYRGLDIGSAKPDAQTLRQFPHRLIDIRDPAEPYSAAEFREDALREMADITARGKIPLLVGGTMLYFKVLREGIADLPATDESIRARVLADAGQLGWPAMHARLAAIDPQSAARLHPNHSQRIGRALEVYLSTGETLSAFHERQEKQSPLPYRVLQLALVPLDRQWLYARINARFDQMMHAGFLEEVQALYKRGDLHGELPAIRAVGYRQAWDYFQSRSLMTQRLAEGSDGRPDERLDGGVGERLTRVQMVERAKMASRQLAKRQLTWLRGWPDLQVVPLIEGAGAGSGSVVGANCLQAVNAFLYPGP